MFYILEDAYYDTFYICFHCNERFIESRFGLLGQELCRNFIEIYWGLLSTSDIYKCRETFILDKLIEIERSAEMLDV